MHAARQSPLPRLPCALALARTLHVSAVPADVEGHTTAASLAKLKLMDAVWPIGKCSPGMPDWPNAECCRQRLGTLREHEWQV